MREILFRGKTKAVTGSPYNNGKAEGEWVKGHLYNDVGCWKIRQFETDYADYIPYEVDPETVGQYTGLTDKNGTKIFEGDIVKYTEFYKFSDNEDLEDAEEKNESISVVKFVNGRFTPIPTRRNCEDYWYSYAEDDFEVVGNIHDNPELLKGGVQE